MSNQIVKNENELLKKSYVILLAITCIFFAHTTDIIHHSSIIILAFMGLVFISVNIANHFPIKIFFLSRLIFIFWAFLSICWSTYYGEVSNRILTYSYCFIIFLSTFFLVDKMKYIETFIDAATISGIFLAIYIFQYSGNHITEVERLGNEAMSINTAASKFAYISLLNLFIYTQKRRKIHLALFMLMSLMVILTGSKMAFLMVLLGSIFFNFINKPRGIARRFKRIFMVIIAVAIAFLVINYIPALYQIFGRRIDQLLQIIIGNVSINASYSTSVRLGLIQEAWEGFLNKPITGWGENNMIYFSKYNLHAHSTLFEILFDFGIVGFISYYLDYFLILVEYLRMNSKSIKSKMTISILVAILIESMTSISHNDLLSWLMLIFAYKIIILEKSKSIISLAR